MIPYHLLLLTIYTPIFPPSSTIGTWWKILPTIFWRILFVRLRTNAKYLRTIHPNIQSSFNFFCTFTVKLITNYYTWSGITVSALCVKVQTILIWLQVQWYHTAWVGSTTGVNGLLIFRGNGTKFQTKLIVNTFVTR